jgi:hypothetical protein
MIDDYRGFPNAGFKPLAHNGHKLNLADAGWKAGRLLDHAF